MKSNSATLYLYCNKTSLAVKNNQNNKSNNQNKDEKQQDIHIYKRAERLYLESKYKRLTKESDKERKMISQILI